MEQPKEKIGMIRPQEGADTHLEAHENINAAITQFYGLFEELIGELNSIEKKYKDADERNFASFSKIKDDIKGLRKDIQGLSKELEAIKVELNEGGKFLTRRYQGIVDTEKEATFDLEPITDEDLRGVQYLASVVINEDSPNQGAEKYSFPKTSLIFDEYTPRIYLKAKEGEHAVLEYDFTIILTEV